METPDYFLRFPNFQRKPALPANVEFDRLARQMKWKRDTKRYRRERSDFLGSEFSKHYGSDATKLENWQSLCMELDIGRSIESITKCRKVRFSFPFFFLKL